MRRRRDLQIKKTFLNVTVLYVPASRPVAMTQNVISILFISTGTRRGRSTSWMEVTISADRSRSRVVLHILRAVLPRGCQLIPTGFSAT
jgi:hypothetical protein